MAQQDVVDTGGTPRTGSLYAVFDNPDQAYQAEQALAALGMQVRVLAEDTEASVFAQPEKSSGLVGKLARSVKVMGGEKHEAERYARHIEEGRTVVTLQAGDREAARGMARTLLDHGAYDVTYFSNWTIEYLSPQENIDRGLPTHSTTNVDE